MTKKEKIKILEGALKMIESGQNNYLCPAVAQAGNWLILSVLSFEPVCDVVRAQKFMTSVGIRKPKSVVGLAWFPCDDEGKAKRISLLKSAIKRLKAKKA